MHFATLWLDHGASTPNGAYAYAVLPGRDAAALQTYAAKPPVEILTNTAEQQVVRDGTSGFTGIVGWQAGEFEHVAWDQPLLILIHESADRLAVAVCDPTMKLTAPVTIRLPHAVKSVGATNDRIKTVSTAPLVLEFDPKGCNGQSLRVEFIK
jgi:hypothetical protein